MTWLLERRGDPWLIDKGNDRQQVEFVVRGELQLVSMAGILTVTGTEAYVAGCLANFGLIQVPADSLSCHLAEERLRDVLPNARPPPLPLSLVHPYQRRAPPRVRVFMDRLTGICARLFGALEEARPT